MPQGFQQRAHPNEGVAYTVAAVHPDGPAATSRCSCHARGERQNRHTKKAVRVIKNSVYLSPSLSIPPSLGTTERVSKPCPRFCVVSAGSRPLVVPPRLRQARLSAIAETCLAGARSSRTRAYSPSSSRRWASRGCRSRSSTRWTKTPSPAWGEPLRLPRTPSDAPGTLAAHLVPRDADAARCTASSSCSSGAPTRKMTGPP